MTAAIEDPDNATFPCCVTEEDFIELERVGTGRSGHVIATITQDDDFCGISLSASQARQMAVALIGMADRIDGTFTTLLTTGTYDDGGDPDAVKP